MKKIFTLLAAAAVGMCAYAQNYTAEAAVTQNPEDIGWGTNYLPEATATVECYDSYVIIRSLAGVEGYDVKLEYNEDNGLTAVTPIVDGEADETVTSGWANVYTGLEDMYAIQFYAGSWQGYWYGYIYDNGEAAGGYAVCSAYFYDNDEYANGVYGAYYIEWDGVPTGPDPIYTAEAAVTQNPEDIDWGTNYLPEATATVDCYDGYIIIRGLAGVEGYDVKLEYNEDNGLTGVTPIVKGEEDATVTSGWANVYTGLEDMYAIQLYAGSWQGYWYGYIYDNGKENGGYAVCSAYFYDNDEYANGVYGAYYIEWDGQGGVVEQGTVYEAVSVINDMFGNLIFANPTTITTYDNGSIYVDEFLGEGYTGASFYFEPMDGDVVFLSGFEYNEYGMTYLNIWDKATESYIQPYLYDADSVWAGWSSFYTGVEDEAEGKIWGTHAAIFMYSEDLIPADAYYYGYVDLYWDCLGESDGISSVAAETENAPVEYYNLNGVRVENPANGIYIVKQGNKVTKQVIR